MIIRIVITPRNKVKRCGKVTEGKNFRLPPVKMPTGKSPPSQGETTLFPHFLRLALFAITALLFDIIFCRITFYKKLSTFSTDFSTSMNLFIYNSFPAFYRNCPQAATATFPPVESSGFYLHNAKSAYFSQSGEKWPTDGFLPD